MKGIKRISIKACNCPVEIEISQLSDGSLLLEKNENGKWFVTTGEKGFFHLQENLENGEIINMGYVDNLPEAIYKIAWAR